MAKLADILNAPRSPQVAILTNQQVRVCRMIAVGVCKKNIADELGICLKTVEKHSTEAYKKLDVHCSIELTRKLLLIGLLDLDEFLDPSFVSKSMIGHCVD